MPVNGDPELTPAPDDQARAFDPTTVPPTPSPTPLSSESPGDVEAHPGDAHGEAEAQAQQPELPEFDPRFREPFEGLMFLGALQKQFGWGGHRFTIRTLRNRELADVAVAITKYAGTDGALKAYQGAITAAALLDVDGKNIDSVMPVPIRNDEDPFLRRFDYVMDNWFPPTLDAIYEKYIELEVTARNVIDAMGKVSG